MRKRSFHTFIAAIVGILCTVCLLSGCGTKSKAKTDRERILFAQQKAGLDGTISESESFPKDARPRHYVIRSEAETHEGTVGSPFVADVVFAVAEGEELLTVFHQSGVWADSTQRIEWEDWKKQFAFAALLYGDFEQEDEIYRAFCDKEMPDGMEQVKWEAELSNGRYCTVALSCMSQKAYNDRGFEGRRYSATMRINIFGSFEQYLKRRIEQEQSMP